MLRNIVFKWGDGPPAELPAMESGVGVPLGE